MNWRKTSQALMPASVKQKVELQKGAYDIYPYASLGKDKINEGYKSLAEWIATQKTVVIDGYVGNDWKVIKEALNTHLEAASIKANWTCTCSMLKSESEIETLVTPFLGEKGTVWGKVTSLSLKDFFDANKLTAVNTTGEINIIIGVGAALTNVNAPIIYIDLPKNELQYRMRACTANNIGKQVRDDNQETYKRFYFVDWIVLNAHKAAILPSITVVADGQWKDSITWSLHTDIKEGLKHMAHNAVRVRPWFEAGAWGGQWMKEKIKGLNPDEVNYAWSFEMIVPENGIVFESNGNLLEIAFDWLMLHNNKEVLGAKDAQRFGVDFPIRFDFLDTFDGGNLSIQCHPRLKYIQENFGEKITQDETYYILDCTPDAKVYLGFQENIDPVAFEKALKQSEATNEPIDIEKYVQKHDAKKHDLFLIPNGTVHSSGKNNLVLEISATPYIFTFKMYDWVRPDLNGKPRPINIDHAMKNLYFERKGQHAIDELISKQSVIEKGNDWQVVHTPTHAEHFYDVHRLEFSNNMEVNTNEKCHILMLVEGSSVIVETKDGFRQRYNYAETFAIPAAAGSYKLINEGTATAKIVKAFLK